MKENNRENEPQDSATSVCLLDGSYFFWEAVVFDNDLSLLLESYGDGEILDTVEQYLDALRNEEIIDENDPEEREVWTVEIPEALQMAMQSKISKLILSYQKQIAGEPTPDPIN